jgi:hypothetical protein
VKLLKSPSGDKDATEDEILHAEIEYNKII